jgi:hypothetical protein
LDNSRRIRILEESLNKLAILTNEVEGTEKTSETTLSEAVMLGEEFFHALIHDLLHFLDMTYDVIINHILHALIPSNAADRVSLIGCTPSNSVSPIEILNIFPETNSRKREIRSRKTLGTCENIRYNAVINLESEHFTTSADPGHDLIDDQKNIIFVSKSSQSLYDLRRVK